MSSREHIPLRPIIHNTLLTSGKRPLSLRWHTPCKDPTTMESTTPMYSHKNLANLPKFNGLAPKVMEAFWAFDKAAVAGGAIPVKYKELIAIAVALTTQCPYCIDIHAGNARAAGANDQELIEAAMVSASLRAGAAVTHATHLLPIPTSTAS